MAEGRDIDPVFGKAFRVLDMPSFLSQSAICCIVGPHANLSWPDPLLGQYD